HGASCQAAELRLLRPAVPAQNRDGHQRDTLFYVSQPPLYRRPRPNPTQHKPDWRSDCAFRIETDHNRHVSTFEIVPRPSITIIGGGTGGYEAALVASIFDAVVTLIEHTGIDGFDVVS